MAHQDICPCKHGTRVCLLPCRECVTEQGYAFWVDESPNEAIERAREAFHDLMEDDDRLREQLRDRSAYLEWCIEQLCPHHNIECIYLGCPATPAWGNASELSQLSIEAFANQDTDDDGWEQA